jgi:hypothetical protein
MTEIRTNLYQKLVGDPGVYAIVGDRIFPIKLPQGTTVPAITYQLIDDPPASQAYGEKSAMPYPRYAINCWAADPDKAVELKEAVKLALECQLGWWEGSAGRRRVWDSRYLGQRELDQPEAGLYIRQLDFRIMHD